MWLLLSLMLSLVTLSQCGLSSSISAHDVATGADTLISTVETLDKALKTIIKNVINAEDSVGQWSNILSKVATAYSDGALAYHESLMASMHVGEKLFAGNYTLHKLSRCSYLSDAMLRGQVFNIPYCETAIAKDMICFRNQLREIQNLQAYTSQVCAFNEDGAMDAVALTIRHLFRLSQDGARFLSTLNFFSRAYIQLSPVIYTTFNTEIEKRDALKRHLDRVS